MTSTQAPYRLGIAVRAYELDSQGHVNHAVYLQYGEHARWEGFRAAGLSQEALLAAGVGPVILEVTARYRRELLLGDEIEVSFGLVPNEGKTIRFEHELRLLDGTLVAEIFGLAGILNLSDRRLVAEPVKRLRELAPNPEILGL